MRNAHIAIFPPSRTHAGGLSRTHHWLQLHPSRFPARIIEIFDPSKKNRRQEMQNNEPLITNRLKQLGYAMIIMLAVPIAAFSQSQITTGTIQGTVADVNGAIVH